MEKYEAEVWEELQKVTRENPITIMATLEGICYWGEMNAIYSPFSWEIFQVACILRYIHS